MSQTIEAAALTESALIALNDALGPGSHTVGLPSAGRCDYRAAGESALASVRSRPSPILFVRRRTGEGPDAANGPAVFEYIGVLDPSNASDPRLWTFLAFSTYRSYMEERWPLVAGANWKNRVQDRWLLRVATRGRLVRHGIARLWWITNLTYDAKREYPLSKVDGDPYAYTRAVFGNEDRLLALFDREAGGSSSVVRAVLEHVGRDAAYGRGSHVRALMKELTLVMGFRDLGVLSESDLDELIEEVRPRYEGDRDDADSLTHGDA